MWTCFMAEPTKKCRITLRRYRSESNCVRQGGLCYHDASAIIGESDEQPLGRHASIQERADPRWPRACPCGYVFVDEDAWVHNADRVYAGGGREFTLADAPVGAIWNAPWLAEIKTYRHADGQSLVLQTPAGAWDMDGPTYTAGEPGPGWRRTGTPPRITVRPSIHFPGKFHGVLTDGVLSSCGGAP